MIPITDKNVAIYIMLRKELKDLTFKSGDPLYLDIANALHDTRLGESYAKILGTLPGTLSDTTNDANKHTIIKDTVIQLGDRIINHFH